MKTTIKKLLKLGLEEKDIKKELDINDKKYNTMKERNTQIKVDNVPELLDKYNSKSKDDIGDVLLADKETIELSKLLDKIYECLDIDKLDISIKDKRDIVKNIPNFIENIRKEVGIKKVQELEKQIERINKQIEELKAEYKIDTNEENKKTDDKEKTDSVNHKNYYFILNEDIKFLSPNYKLGKPNLMVRISKEIINQVKSGDVFHIKENENESKTYLYTVVDKRKSGHMRYLKISLGMNAGTI